MKIALDARMMGPMITRGIGRYVEELVRAMIELAPDDTFVLFERTPEASPFLDHPNVEHVKADIPWYGWNEQLGLARLFEEAQADLIHVPHWNVPLMYRGPLVITIHDLILRHQPRSAKVSTRHPLIALAKRGGHRVALKNATSRAKAILVPTQWVADDVQKLYPEATGKVFVTGEGISRLPDPDFARVPDDPFLLYVGAAYPHKGLNLLLDAWQTLSARYPAHWLVLAGEEDVFMAKLVARVHNEKIPRVRFTGRVSDAELAGLFARAQAFVFPSEQEGFGLPPLEALSHGCPVISSDATSLPEVLPKEGVFFFRSGDKNGMIEAIDRVLMHLPETQRIARDQAQQLRQAYQWKTVAERTLDVYRRVHATSLTSR